MTAHEAVPAHGVLVREACGDDPGRAFDALDRLILEQDAEAVSAVYRGAPMDAVREHAAAAMASIGTTAQQEAFFDTLLRAEFSPHIRLRAIEAFHQTFPMQALHAIVEMLGPGDPGLRAAAARLLGDAALTMPEPNREGLTRIYEAFLLQWDEAVTGPLGYFLSTKSDPRTKLDLLVSIIEGSDWLVRENVDGRCAALSLGLHDSPVVRSEITADLVRRVHQSGWTERVTGIIATLLVGVSGSRDQAARTLNAMVLKERLSEASLRELRLELGGRTALRPVLEEAENTFSEPLQKLFDKTMTDWQEATHSAQTAFRWRVAMSVVVFAAGLLVTLVSTYQVVFAGAGAELWGPGVSLAAGLASMLGVVYKGPLADVKRSVIDLAATDIAFIGFMHRLQFTTGLVQSDYAHGRMSQQSAEAAGHLLDDALAGWERSATADLRRSPPSRPRRP